jgi:O-antigen/teichoic acid export membrane protein
LTSNSEPAAGGQAPTERGRLLGYLKTTLRHGGMYTLGMVLSRIVGFVMIPVYTRILTPGDYGVLEILSLTTDIVSLVAGLGIGMAVTRYYYYYESPEDKGTVVSSAAFLIMGVFGLAGAAGLAGAGFASEALLGSPESAGLVRLAVLGFVLNATMDVPMVYLRARQQSTKVVVIGTVKLIAGLSLNILFVVILRLGVAGVLYTTIITSGLTGAYLLTMVFRETGVRIAPAMVGKLVRYGAPLIVWNIGSFALHYSDRYFLRVYESLTEVGLYSISYKLAMLIPMFISGPFNNIWLPKALEIHQREGPNAVPIQLTILRYFNLALVTTAFGISLFATEALRIATGAAFHGAAGPVPLLALAMVFFSYRSISQIGAIIKERTGQIAISTSVAAVVVIALNFLLIPRWGINGAAVATLGAFGIEFFVMRELSARVYPLRFALPALLTPMVVGCVVWFGAHAVVAPDAPILLSLGVKSLAVVAFLGGLVLTRAMPRDDLRMVGQAARNPLQALRVLRGA